MTDIERREASIYEWVGRRVRELRIGKFTQEELADVLQLSRTSITNLENGRQRLPLHHLVRLAEALGCEVADLLPRRSDLDGPDVDADLTKHMTIVGELTPSASTLIRKYVATGGTRDPS